MYTIQNSNEGIIYHWVWDNYIFKLYSLLVKLYSLLVQLFSTLKEHQRISKNKKDAFQNILTPVLTLASTRNFFFNFSKVQRKTTIFRKNIISYPNSLQGGIKNIRGINLNSYCLKRILSHKDRKETYILVDLGDLTAILPFLFTFFPPKSLHDFKYCILIGSIQSGDLNIWRRRSKVTSIDPDKIATSLSHRHNTICSGR